MKMQDIPEVESDGFFVTYRYINPFFGLLGVKNVDLTVTTKKDAIKKLFELSENFKKEDFEKNIYDLVLFENQKIYEKNKKKGYIFNIQEITKIFVGFDAKPSH